MKRMSTWVAGWLVLAASVAAAQDTWKTRAQAPGNLSNHGMAAVGGKVYAVAGWNPNSWSPSPVTYEYDPVTDTWTNRAPSPGLYNVAAAAFDGKLYIAGGVTAGEDRDSAALHRYDPASDTWTALAPMSGPRYFHGLVATATHLHAVGGYRMDVGGLATCEKYDPAADAWSPSASLPLALMAPYAGAIHGKVYVAGGYNDWYGGSTQTLEYDPASDRWTRKADFPVYGGSWAGGSASLGGRLWCLGGEGWYSDATASTLEYRPWTDSWTTRAKLPYGNYYGAACAAGGRIWSLGHQYDYYASIVLQEYEAPSFGSAPSVPAGLRQVDGQGREVTAGGWMAGATIRLEATLADADAGEPVALEIEVRPVGTPFSGSATGQGSLDDPGLHAVVMGGLDGHDYAWRARAVDVNENASAWVDFSGPSGADFRNDQAPPSAPSCDKPWDGDEIQVAMREGGGVTFAWSGASDNAGIASYELQIAMDEAFYNVQRTATSESATLPLSLATSRYAYHWRVRAVDVSGNVGPWSRPAAFRVFHEDRRNHGAGDAVKFCGFSAGTGRGSILAGLALAVVLAAAARLRRAATLAILLAAAVPASAQDSWTNRATAPYPVSEAGAATVNGRVYVFGGYSYNFYYGIFPYCYAYDPATDSWSSRASMPVGVGDMAVAVDGGNIYSVGGFVDSWYGGAYVYGTVPYCFRYDVAADAWTRVADLATPRSHGAAGAVEGKIYAVAGFQYDTQLAIRSVECYDPSSDAWSSRADYPEDQMLAFYGVASGRLVVAGGWLNDYSASRKTYAYDATNDAWIARAEMPLGNWGGGSAVVGQRMYCFGSGADASYETRNYEYSVLGDRWVRRADLATGLSWAPAAGTADRAYAFGHAIEYGLAWTTREYTPPDFGQPPSSPSGLVQRVPGADPLGSGAWMGGNSIEFSASVTDADSAQVGLQVEVRRVGEAFTGVPTATGTAGPAGVRDVVVGTLQPGDYAWRLRSYDDLDNVSAWSDFNGPADVDFRNEQTGPTRPVALAPVGGAALAGTPVTFSWTEATDDRGLSGYRVEVSADPGFGSILLFAESATPSAGLGLAPSWMTYYWRVRAEDSLGNVGAWSRVESFSVVQVESDTHEEKKGCLGSTPGGLGAGGLLLGLLLGAGALRRAGARFS